MGFSRNFKGDSRKRPHSPDLYAIGEFKKSKLIEDLERLSLNDDVVSENNGLQIVDHNKFRRPHKDDTSHPGDRKWVITQIVDLMRAESLQVIPWIDYKQFAYNEWLKWYKIKLLSDDTLMIDIDNLLENDFYMRVEPTSNYRGQIEGNNETEDMNIDID